jgi:hypothetical protein
MEVSMFKNDFFWSRPASAGQPPEDAMFMGWQENRSGDAFALYNITAPGHPLLGSTVTDKRLIDLHLQVPATPDRSVK